MTFTSGQKIQADHYNTLINDLHEVYAIGSGDKGYGATPLPIVGTPPPFNSANLVDNQNWLDLRSAIADIGNHQGSIPTLPDTADIEDGDEIQAFTSLEAAIITVSSNRLNVDAGSIVVDNAVLTDQRINDWIVQIGHVFTVDFTTDDAARHFFNTGGQIRLTMSGPDGVDAHNWGNVYDVAGTFIFDHNSYYGLSSTINNSVDILIANTGGGVYTVLFNVWAITARYIAGTSANGARGSKIEISSTSTDVYSDAPDNVVATTPFISTIGERRSVTFFNQPQPIYSTVVSLTDGN